MHHSTVTTDPERADRHWRHRARIGARANRRATLAAIDYRERMNER
jgi:hypothetical protein